MGTRARRLRRTIAPHLRRGSYRMARGVIVGFFRLYWRVRIDGLEHIPASGAFIVAPIHRSNVDFVLAGMVTKRRVRFLAKATLWQAPLLGLLLDTMGAVPVERGAPDRAALRAIEDALRAGEPVVIFPEGTRQSGPTVGVLFDGVAYVAQKTGAPIIPVGIGGSEEAMPKGSRWIAPAHVSVTVGPALPPVAGGGARASRRLVRERTASLAVALQDTFDRARRPGLR